MQFVVVVSLDRCFTLTAFRVQIRLGVVTGQDGIPAYASVASGSETWREFRLLIDGGKVGC